MISFSKPLFYSVPICGLAILFASCDNDLALAQKPEKVEKAAENDNGEKVAEKSKDVPPTKANEPQKISPPTVYPAMPEPFPAVMSRIPYLQLATPSSIQVLWRMRGENKPVLKYGPSQESLTSSVTGGSGILIRRLAKEGSSSPGTLPLFSAPPHTRQYEAEIKDLQPDTKYYYAVFDGEKRITPDDGSFSFRTLPVAGTDRPAWMWVAGDGGTGGKIQAAVHQAMINYTKEQNVSLDMFLHVGDMAYSYGYDPEFQGRFFEMYGTTLRNTVCWPAMGNHEGRSSRGLDGVGPYYDAFRLPTKGEAGGVPSGREAYYSFDYGKIHFVVLDSCNESFTKKHVLTTLGDSMMQWLKEDLEKAKADWLISYWHHPPYTKGSHNSDDERDYESIVMREKFLPLLESAGVDLVLCGHSHIYERSMLIDGAYSTPTTAKGVVINDGDGDAKGDGAYTKSAGLNPNEGMVSIVTGNAGTTLKRLGTIPLMKKIILEHGSVVLNVNGDTLHGIMLNKDGKQSDVFDIVKKGKLEPREKIADPQHPPIMPLLTSVKADGSKLFTDPKPTTAKPKASPGSDGDSEARSSQKLPEAYTELIPRGDVWRYQMGNFTFNWNSQNYDDSAWLTGKSGFGYGDDDDETVLAMKGKTEMLFVRHDFTLTGTEDLKKLGLAISYDDSFIVYINGTEIVRSTNVKGEGDRAKVKPAHEAENEFEYFSLEKAAPLLKPGKNIIAIQGVNDERDSSDFSLHPVLLLAK